ncbi:helix-turn-helix transcriptional regulator [Microbispora amethystogenes]|uniref:helix-turn-helix domain-containing protein n=1 Tax=Microbispora amethystogenes TaxID=1427754 RepID=UPI0033CFD388
MVLLLTFGCRSRVKTGGARLTEPSAVEDLAAYIRQLKDKTGRSYDALAKRLGVGRSTLHRYCSGGSVPPRFTFLEQFAKECQASHAEILELHRRWVRAQTSQPPETRPGPEQRAEQSAEQLLEQRPEQHGEKGAEQRVEPPDGPAGSPGPPPTALPAAPDAPPGYRRLLGSSRTRWVLAGLAVLVMGGALIWRPGQDSRASAESGHSCTDRSGVKHVDARQGGLVWTRDFVCANRPDTPLYLSVDSTEKVAILDTPRSWFVCWEFGRVQGDGGRVWYYTRGDRAEPGKESWEGWGFVGSEHVDAAAHPLPGMPRCPFASASP